MTLSPTTPTPQSLILVTGATGFLGSYIVDYYINNNIPVRALVRPTSNLHWLEPHLKTGQVTLAYGSMTDAASLKEAVQGVSHIVHTAAVIGGKNVPRELYERVNVEGTRILLEAAVQEGIQRFSLISSVSTYGYGAKPGGQVTEETLQAPSNPYGESKLAQQKLVFEAYQKDGLPVVSIEPPIIYGPRARVGIGPAFSVVKYRLAPMLDYGRGRMKPVYVTDVVGLLEAADKSEAANGERFLAAGPRFVTHKEILQLVAQSLKVRPLYLPIPLWTTVVGLSIFNALLRLRGKPKFFKATYFIKFSKGADYRTEKAERLLGWHPKVDVQEGILKTGAWFKEQGLI